MGRDLRFSRTEYISVFIWAQLYALKAYLSCNIQLLLLLARTLL